MTENYNISTDFSNNFNQTNFHTEIAASSLSSKFQYIERIDSDIVVHFTESLSESEKTILDTLVTNHDSTTNTIYNSLININLNNNKINSTVFERVASFNYEGSLKVGPIQNLLFSSYADSGITNYTVRIFDKTNNLVIEESNFTNTSEDINELTPINNIPETRATIEVLIKKTGGPSNKYVHVNSITFYF